MGQKIAHWKEPESDSMEPLRRSYLVEQTAVHLRDALRRSPSGSKLPGVVRLASQLGVSKATLRGAIRVLETEGVISLSEDGFSRYVTRQKLADQRRFQIGILLYDALVTENPTSQRLVLDIQSQLERAGFGCFLSSVSQSGLRHNVAKIGRYINRTEADAWVVAAGSLHLLGWFVAQGIPCMALAGRRRSYPLASVGPDALGTTLEVIRKLIGLGHRRIVFLCRKPLRQPEPGHVVKAFIAEMAAHGIPVSAYNVPDWDESREGLKTLLDSLFRVTPPTAIIVANVQFVPAIIQFLGNRRIMIPSQISLVASDDDPSFEWCDPEISRIRWNSALAVRRIVRWAGAISRGREDLKQNLYPSEFVPGATIDRAPIEETKL
jgi:DNA-binding LacI/PurR family transcriptional regulator